jgi:ATP-dependent RNA helicase DHX8/PRP22
MHPPQHASLVAALEELSALGALDEEGLLTKLGRKMASFPLEPPLAKMLLASVALGCAEDILTITAMLSVQHVFSRPRDRLAAADARKRRFHQPEGDHLTLLAVYDAWRATKYSSQFCFDNFLQLRTLKRAQDVRRQLVALMDRHSLEIASARGNTETIRKAIVAGFFQHAARVTPGEGYKTVVEETPVFIHPSSALFQKAPTYVLYHELVQTSKEWMREVVQIDPKWLVEFAPRFFKQADGEALTARKKNERIAPLSGRPGTQENAWRLSSRARQR